MPSYKLFYFNACGRAETIRYIFAEADQKYEDVRVKKAEWPEKKSTFLFGQIPVLEVDGKQLPEAKAISRYVANKFGLAGKNDWEKALMDSYGDLLSDFSDPIFPIVFEQDAEKKKEKQEHYFENTLNKILPLLEKATGNEFIVGSKVSWVDLMFAAEMKLLTNFFSGTLDKYPHCAAHMKKIESRPNVAKWIKNRPATDF